MNINNDEIKVEGVNVSELKDDSELVDIINGKGKAEETSADSSTENNNGKEEEDAAASQLKKEDEEKDIPFHEHPRFKELVQTKNELKEKLEEASKTISELKTSFEKKEDEPIAGWFKELYGENEDAWKIYSAQTKRDREETKKEILKELEAKTNEEVENNVKWNNWRDSELSKLEESGKKFDRNKLLKLMVDYKPTDNNGNLDFEKGYSLYEKLYKEEKDVKKNEIKKKVADMTSGGKQEKDKPLYLTANDLRHKSFSSLIGD